MAKKLGNYVDNSPKTWVQTERAAHEAWGRLAMSSPRAAALLHHLVANMGNQNAVVINQTTLSKMMRCDKRTIQRAVADLLADNWMQVVNLGGAGTVNAYVINDQVAWGEKRDNMPRTSTFSARIIADIDDQSDHDLTRANLRKIPMLFANERQLPTGPGEPPPSQPSIGGMELDLPTLQGDHSDPWAHLRNPTPEQQKQMEIERGRIFSVGLDSFERDELEKRGQQRLTE